MDKRFFVKILRKYLNGEATDEEEQFLFTYYNLFENEPDVVSLLNDEELVNIKHQLDEGLWANIKERETSPDTIIPHWKFKEKSNWLWLKIAATLLIVISATLIIRFKHSTKSEELAGSKIIQHDVMPGGNKAVLTLSNGQHIVLDQLNKGQIAVQHNTVINKVNDGQLVYASNHENQVQPANVSWNTLTIPTGGQYNIVLPDGTKVFLNSQSTLSFPTSFTGNERNVTLTGEAYFEVAKNPAMPFKINVANHQTVEVLGTHFNIMAYENDNNIETTLLEGSVKISSNGHQTMLKPGEMANNDLKSSVLTVRQADIDDVMAWKNGYFRFHNEGIKNIMKKASRWYNIDIVYSGNVTNHTFGGIYARNRELSELLKGLESTGIIHFSIEGRRITVMP